MRNGYRWGIAVAVFVAALAVVLLFNDHAPFPLPPGGRGPARPAQGGTEKTTAGVEPMALSSAPSAAPAKALPAPATPETAEVVDDPAAPHGALEGRVLSAATLAGVPGAELTFARGAAAATATSGADGRFTFAPPLEGTWRLAAASAAGFLPFAPEWGHSPILLEAVPGRRLRGSQIFLTPAIDYLGLVLDPSGKPVPGAEVRLLGAGAGEQVLLPMKDRFSTDAKGEFRFQARDGAVLEARHPDFAPARGAIDFSARVSHRVVLRLRTRSGPARPAQAIAGRVVDPREAPVSGAVVVAEREVAPGEGEASSLSAQATSDAEGRFRLEPLDPGSYRVGARQEGWAPAEQRGVQAGTPGLVLRLTPGASLVGSVRDERGAPLPSFTVNVWRRSGLALDLAFSGARFDPGGRFEITGLPPGPALASATAPGFAASKSVELALAAAPAPPASVDFTLSRGARITGQVMERGSRRPLADAHIEVEGWSGAAAAGSASPNRLRASTDAAGAFQIAGVAAGKAALLVSAPEHHGRVVPSIDVPESGDAAPVAVELTPVENGQEPRVELAGLGLVLQAQGDALMVQRVVALGGGAEAGLAPGDAILAIAGKAATQLGFEGAIDAIRGPEGTEVTLKVRRADGQVVELVAHRRVVRN